MGKYLHIQVHNGQTRRMTAAIDQMYDAKQRLLLTPPPVSLNHPTFFASETVQSLQVAIEMSDQQLSEEGQSALRALSVFPANT